MGMCPGQAPMTIGPLCLLRVKTVQSQENSASCGVLADLIQYFISIGSVNYTFSVKIPLGYPLKMGMGTNINTHSKFL